MKATFREWLVGEQYDPKTISTRIANAARVEEYHGDVDGHFAEDRLDGLISSLRYSTEDQRNGRPSPSLMRIDGDIRTNLATYRSAIVLYKKFRLAAEVFDKVPGQVVSHSVSPCVAESHDQHTGSEPESQLSLRRDIKQSGPGLSHDDTERSAESVTSEIAAPDFWRHRALQMEIRSAAMPMSDMRIDGLRVLRAEIGLKEIALLIERTARWVSPETFHMLPVWFPEHARGRYFYKANWSEPQMNRRRATGVALHWTESNTYAGKALSLVLGLRNGDRPNWSCCHIWGVDDPTYQNSNVVVQDRRLYSCVANMVLLPTPLKAFTDTMPGVKAMLRIFARNLYGWECDHDAMKPVNAELHKWTDWNSYPSSWPRTPDDQKRPLGVVELTPGIERSAHSRLSAIRTDMKNAGQFFPREDVVNVLAYWKIAAEPI